MSDPLVYAETELGEPTWQCRDCGSLGPFRGITYPSSPNGPEEYDMVCQNCNSSGIAESPQEAFNAVLARADEAENERDNAIAAFKDATRLRSQIQQARIKAEDERDVLTEQVRILRDALEAVLYDWRYLTDEVIRRAYSALAATDAPLWRQNLAETAKERYD